MQKYPLCINRVEAQYTQQSRALYQNNPWIEALPDNLDDKELYHALQVSIPYDERERQLPAYERKECIQALAHVFIPLGQNGEIARKVASAIREGYVTRNPMSSCWTQNLGQLQSCVHSKDGQFLSMSGANANACGFCIVGDSGMGKTSAVNHALAMFPQVIFHHQYCNEAFACVQMVWMRLECPQDASVKGLCSEFFMEFDRITGDNTFVKYASGGRATTDQLIPQMALVAQRHGLGLLVIDEIQNLNAAKSGGAQRMLNFIVQLVNTIGIPVLLVGTPPAIGLLSADLMTARRSSGQQGMTYLRPLEKGACDWMSFTKGFWKYQWTTEKVELSPTLQNILHDLSHGNIDAAVKLYMEVQRLAIMKRLYGQSEIITPGLLQDAAAGDALRMVLRRLELEHGESLKSGKEKSPIKRLNTEPVVAQAGLSKPGAIVKTEKQATKTVKKTGAELLTYLEENGQLLNQNDEF